MHYRETIAFKHALVATIYDTKTTLFLCGSHHERQHLQLTTTSTHPTLTVKTLEEWIEGHYPTNLTDYQSTLYNALTHFLHQQHQNDLARTIGLSQQSLHDCLQFFVYWAVCTPHIAYETPHEYAYHSLYKGFCHYLDKKGLPPLAHLYQSVSPKAEFAQTQLVVMLNCWPQTPLNAHVLGRILSPLKRINWLINKEETAAIEWIKKQAPFNEINETKQNNAPFIATCFDTIAEEVTAGVTSALNSLKKNPTQWIAIICPRHTAYEQTLIRLLDRQINPYACTFSIPLIQRRLIQTLQALVLFLTTPISPHCIAQLVSEPWLSQWDLAGTIHSIDSNQIQLTAFPSTSRRTSTQTAVQEHAPAQTLIAALTTWHQAIKQATTVGEKINTLQHICNQLPLLQQQLNTDPSLMRGFQCFLEHTTQTYNNSINDPAAHQERQLKHMGAALPNLLRGSLLGKGYPLWVGHAYQYPPLSYTTCVILGVAAGLHESVSHETSVQHRAILKQLPLHHTPNKTSVSFIRQWTAHAKTIHLSVCKQDNALSFVPLTHTQTATPTHDKTQTIPGHSPLPSRPHFKQIQAPNQLSATSLDVYQRCPYQFWLAYIVAAHTPDMPLDSPTASEWGETLHDCLCTINKALATQKTNDRVAHQNLFKQIGQQAANTWPNELGWVVKKEKWLGTPTQPGLLETLEAIYWDQPLLHRVVSAEEKLSLHIEGKTLTCVVDAVFHGDNIWSVIDYKTGKNLPTKTDVHNHQSLQLPIYMMALHVLKGLSMDIASTFRVVDGSLCEIDFTLISNALKKAKTIKTKKKPGVFETTFTEKTGYIVRSLIHQLDKGYFKTAPNKAFHTTAATRKKACQACSYLLYCRFSERFKQ